MDFSIRPAVDADVPTLRALIEASVRGLHTPQYTAQQIDRALETVYGVDSQLIADRTYFVADVPGVSIAGCGGWSRRATLHGGDAWTERSDAVLDPQIDAARIRAFFVHPQWTRRGIGTAILDACERAAAAAGFTRFELSATLTGAYLYAARGYVAVANVGIALGSGVLLPTVRMEKRL